MTLLGLHGFGGCGLDWTPVAEALGRTIVAPDLLGHGEAEAPEGSDQYRAVNMVESAVTAWPTENPAVVLGYSMGGRVALRLALAEPKKVQAMVLIGAQPGLENPEERAERIARDHALAGRIEENGVEWFCEHWAQQPMIRSQQNIPDAIRLTMGQRRLRNRTHGLAGSLRGFGQGAVEPVWDALGSIAVPTLLITGVNDTKYCALAQRMIRRMPRAQHCAIDNAGHCAHLENLSAASSAIAQFLDSLSE